MNSIRNKSILRVLGLALVLGVLFVGGWAGDSFAEMHMQNGHEGDPGDAFDMVSGGTGDGNAPPSESSGPSFNDSFLRPLFQVFFLGFDSGGRPVFKVILLPQEMESHSAGLGELRLRGNS